ncbi:hypothetical protein DdX_02240 [Ditylenchus destructor]|uniref:Uncharacterized protein n=1 Tax=Ditylenchus destructor TaxID=166010 RepID=A0AAD4NEJ0_9BILA|nr:hypothetical protein DdX_02240 [Ditylenchus destructor]
MFRVIVMFAAFSMYQQSHVHVAPFGEKFKIEKELLLVNVNGCHIVSKAVSDEGPCEIFRLAQSEPDDGQCDSILAAPLFAPGNHPELPPRLFIVRHKANERFLSIEYTVVDIPYSRDGAVSIQEILAFNTFPLRRGARMEGFLYDNTNQHVYLLTSDSEKLFCYVFLLNYNKKFSGSISMSFLYKFDVDRIFSHAKWSTDPYRQQFYYETTRSFVNSTAAIEKQPASVELYFISYPLFVSSLKNGVPGQKFGEFSPSDASVQIVGNLIYVTSSNKALVFELEELQYQRAHCRVAKSGNVLFGLSGSEYCKLRKENDIDLCERTTFGNKVKWYHVLVVTMFIFFIVLAVVLCLYRYRMSKKKSVKMNLARPYSHYRSEEWESFNDSF